jgi:hypothetical protein
MTTLNQHHFEAFDDYLASRTGRYEYRAVRYEAACRALTEMGIDNNDTLYDIGAGFTEFDYHLRVSRDWRGRYIPIDCGIDGTDLNYWVPPRDVQFTVALEILEHLENPGILVSHLQDVTSKAIVVSVPNPRTVDVLGIDDTHVTVVTRDMLEGWGFRVEERTFYGGVFSNGEPDSLFGVWEG